MPVVQNTNVKLVKIPKWFWMPYFLFRRLTKPKEV
jgi:hypothetical protein